MVIIRATKLALVSVLAFLITFSTYGCKAGSEIYEDVNFSDSLNAKIYYNKEVYNTKIKYQNDTLFLYFFNDKSLDKLIIQVNSDNVYILFDDISKKFVANNLNGEFFPLTIYRVISKNDGVIEGKQLTNENGSRCYTETFENTTIKFIFSTDKNDILIKISASV